jgi:hypothetical protein
MKKYIKKKKKKNLRSVVQGASFARRRHERIRSARWLAFNLRGCGRSATQRRLVVSDSPEALLRERGLLFESELEGESERGVRGRKGE